MSTPVRAFGSVERALVDLLVRDYAPLTGLEDRIGGEMPGTVDSWYVRVDKIPGGSSDSFEGTFVVDVEVFSQDYLNAEKIAMDIESLILAHGYHVVISGGRRWVFDDVIQNVGPADLPWDGDDDTHRIGATYVFTVRRGALVGPSIPAPVPTEEAPITGAAAYTHTQYASSAIWIIEHNLGYRPGGVRVAADNGDTYYPVIVDLDENRIRLTMAEPITGKAYLS